MLHVQTQVAVMSVPVTLDSLEMDSNALVRLEFNAFLKIFRGRLHLFYCHGHEIKMRV